MNSLREQIKQHLTELINEGSNILADESQKAIEAWSNATNSLRLGEAPKTIEVKPVNILYQSWYTEALMSVKQLLPDRYNEFRKLYDTPDRQSPYTISDYVVGYQRVTKGS